MAARQIDGVELIGVTLSVDRSCLQVTLRDQMGQSVRLSLPTGWLNKLLEVLPRQIEPSGVHELDSWSMERSDNGQDLVLTLRTAEGLSVSFATKPWQVEGMATIATYGSSGPMPVKTVH